MAAAPATDPIKVAVATPVPTVRRTAAKPREAEPATATLAAANPPPHASYAAAYAPPPSPVYAPIVSAFASQKPSQPARAPVMQRASAGLSEATYSSAPYNAPAPYVGSALGMAHGALAAPVPVGGAAELGSSYGR